MRIGAGQGRAAPAPKIESYEKDRPGRTQAGQVRASKSESCELDADSLQGPGRTQGQGRAGRGQGQGRGGQGRAGLGLGLLTGAWHGPAGELGLAGVVICPGRRLAGEAFGGRCGTTSVALRSTHILRMF